MKCLLRCCFFEPMVSLPPLVGISNAKADIPSLRLGFVTVTIFPNYRRWYFILNERPSSIILKLENIKRRLETTLVIRVDPKAAFYTRFVNWHSKSLDLWYIIRVNPGVMIDIRSSIVWEIVQVRETNYANWRKSVMLIRFRVGYVAMWTTYVDNVFVSENYIH